MARVGLLIFVLAIGAAAGMLLTSGGQEVLRSLKAELELRSYLSDVRAFDRDSNQRVTMADGVHLATDVYLPSDGAGPWPALLLRLPYGKTRYFEVRQQLARFAGRGYAIVVQDMRGRYGSDGVFVPWANAAADGAATLDWIAAAPWSDGQIATIGCSALGESQLAMGALGHPAHRALVPVGAGGGAGTIAGLHQFFGIFEGGVPALATSVGWFARHGGMTPDRTAGPPYDPGTTLTTLPIRDAVQRTRTDPTAYETLLDGFTDPGFWDRGGYLRAGDVIAAPTLFVDGWFDPNVNATLAMVAALPAATAIIGPGTHCDLIGPWARGRVGDVAVDPTGQRDIPALITAYLDHHLKGGPAPELPAYLVYMIGADRWIESAEWPPAATAARVWSLDGPKLTAGPPVVDTPRAFISDPADPVPSLGGAICCTGNPDEPVGPVDQRPIEDRADLLLYTSDGLAQPLEIAGPIHARLRVSVDRPDTDLILRLTDVAPDGRSILIQEGALRLRYRDGFDQPALLTPGETYDVEVRLRDIAWAVPAGHRLRLHVAGTSFPRLARNLNGGGDPHRETIPHTAQITIHGGTLELFAFPD